MAEFDVDLFVIGGGSGGVRAARIAAVCAAAALSLLSAAPAHADDLVSRDRDAHPRFALLAGVDARDDVAVHVE